MIASSFTDPVLGVDIHFEMVPMPAPVPTPIPNPFTGVVFDPMGLAVGLAMGAAMSMVTGAQVLGPVVYWGAFPATNTGTEAKHVPGHILIPPGTAWAPFPKAPKPVMHPGEVPAPGLPVKPENDAVCVFGSKTVSVMGSNAVRLGDIALSCSEPVRLPSSVVLAIPKGPVILIGGPPSLDLMAAFMASLRTRFVSDSLHALLSRMRPSRFRNALSRVVCFFTGHPVDVASGKVMTDAVDAELPGPIPLKIERVYSSAFASRPGPLGHGWSHSLDQALWTERGKVVLLEADGRELEFDTFDFPDHVMRPGHELWHPIDRLTLRCRTGGRWEVAGADGLVREFAPVPGRTDGRAMIRRIHSRKADAEILFEYDARGRLEGVRDSAGRLLSLEHDHGGRLVALKLPLPSGQGWSVHARYLFDDDGDLRQVTDATGHSWTFEYATHLLVRETNRDGLSYHFVYDGLGEDAWCVRTWGDGGLYDQRLIYDKKQRVTYVTNSLGHTKTYHMGAAGQVVKIVDAKGMATRYEHDTNLRVVARHDPGGSSTRYRFDARGNCVEIDRAGVVVKYAYDACDQRTAHVDVCGRRTEYRRDAVGRLLSVHRSNGDTERYQYERGQISAHVTADGAVTRFERDAEGNLTRAHLPSGGTVIMEYDRLGRMTVHRNTSGGRSARSYDALGRLIARTDVDGATWTFERSGEGDVVRSHGPERDVRFGYWARGRPAWRLEAGLRSSYRIDTEGQPVAIVNDAGEEWTLEYDAAGRVVAETSFDGVRRCYERDPMGRVVALTKPSGVRIEIERDDLGRPLAIKHPDGQDRYRYAPDGRLLAASNDDAELELERDELGRLIREASGDGEVLTAYGPHGTRQGLRSSLGLHVAVERGPDRRVARVEADWSGVTADIGFDRGASGRERARRLPGEVTVAWSRDEAGRPVERQVVRAGETLEAESYRWGGGGRSIDLVVNSQRGVRRIDHDGRGYADAEVTSTGPPVIRAADAAGNVFETAERTDRRYAPGGRLLSYARARLEYDADGNLVRKQTADGDFSYSYDAFGLLRKVVRPDGAEISYGYDALRRRVCKRTPRGETRWIWDRHQVLHELPAKGAPVTWLHQPNGAAVLGRLDRGGGDRAVVSAVPSPGGAASALMDRSGAVIWSGDLDLYGKPSSELPESWPWRWPGHYEDREIGLYYNRFRYYDPDSGRYLTPDPIGPLGGLNPYAYCRDPVVGIDPFGLAECGPFENKLPGRLEDELADAARLGVSPMRIGDEGFEELVNSGRVKWAINEAGELLVIPHSVNGEEIAHSVLTGGRPVLAAGEADIVAAGDQMIATEITRHSGHFEPSEASLGTGVDAFRNNGVTVPESSINPNID